MIIACATLVISSSISCSTVHARTRSSQNQETIDRLQRVATRFKTFAAVPDDPRGRIAYGTERGNVYVLEFDNGYYRKIWSSPPLTTRIQEVQFADLDGDGRYALIAYNTRGHIVIWNIDDFSVRWESPGTQFASIEALTTAQVDRDPQLEILFMSEGRLYIYDGKFFVEKWRSQQIYDATDIVVGDVDGDGEPEIILNTGFVLDAFTRSLKWESPEEFGEILELADIDGDGKLELISGSVGATKIWDIDMRREKWE